MNKKKIHITYNGNLPIQKNKITNFYIDKDYEQLNIYKYSNANFFIDEINQSTNMIRIQNNSTIIFMHAHYWHFLIDCIGRYLFIKEVVPDLKLFLHEPHAPKLGPTSSYVDEILNFLKIPHVFISNLECQVISFKNLYDFEEKTINQPLSAQWCAPEILKIVRKEILKKCFIKKSYNNIYISRKKVINDDYTNNKRKINNEEILEEYFKSIGYEIIYLEGMPFEDQINLFYNAKKIVGMTGTNIGNSLFCQSGTLVVEIVNAIHDYNYDRWEFHKEIGNLNYKRIILKQTQDAYDVINQLKELKDLINF
jgi:capsular polysaccharide biosynthesis protein